MNRTSSAKNIDARDRDPPVPLSASPELPESAATAEEAAARMRARLAVVAWMAQTLKGIEESETA